MNAFNSARLDPVVVHHLMEGASVYIQMPAMWALVLFICLLVASALYQSLRSPLAKLPGPLHTKFTAAWLKYKEFTGNRRAYIHDLHQELGPVIRLGPNEVSFASAEAIKEIYTSGGSGYEKTEFYNLFKQFSTRYDMTFARGHLLRQQPPPTHMNLGLFSPH